jgi:Spy/CpxP family protein refolding chaperone
MKPAPRKLGRRAVRLTAGKRYDSMKLQAHHYKGGGTNMGMHGCQHHHFMGMGMGMHGHMEGMRTGKWLMMFIMKVMKMKDELNLSEDQINNLKAIRADYVRSAMKMKAEILVMKMDMMGSMSMQEPDFNQMRSSVKSIMSMKTDKKIARIDAFEKASKVLTADQKKKLMEMMCEWMGKGEEGE